MATAGPEGVLWIAVTAVLRTWIRIRLPSGSGFVFDGLLDPDPGCFGIKLTILQLQKYSLHFRQLCKTGSRTRCGSAYSEFRAG